MMLEEDREGEEVVLVPPGGESGAAYPPDPAAHDVNIGLLILFAVILAGIMASNIWLRRRAERDKP